MAKNRRIPKRRSVVMTNTMRVGAVLGMLFVMSIINLLASSSCQQLLKAIGEAPGSRTPASARRRVGRR